MMTDLGLFFIPAALSAFSKEGNVQPPAVPSAAKLPIFSKLRREKLSEMRKFCRPGYLSIWQALVEIWWAIHKIITLFKTRSVTRIHRGSRIRCELKEKALNQTPVDDRSSTVLLQLGLEHHFNWFAEDAAVGSKGMGGDHVRAGD
ncbi:MAG: hypothetical protein WCK15_16205 [Pirellula sp.]